MARGYRGSSQRGQAQHGAAVRAGGSGQSDEKDKQPARSAGWGDWTSWGLWDPGPDDSPRPLSCRQDPSTSVREDQEVWGPTQHALPPAPSQQPESSSLPQTPLRAGICLKTSSPNPALFHKLPRPPD